MPQSTLSARDGQGLSWLHPINYILPCIVRTPTFFNNLLRIVERFLCRPHCDAAQMPLRAAL
jgi:hypothetical protein